MKHSPVKVVTPSEIKKYRSVLKGELEREFEGIANRGGRVHTKVARALNLFLVLFTQGFGGQALANKRPNKKEVEG